jgi:hypothetical protein
MRQPLTRYSEPSGVLRLSIIDWGHAQSQFTTATTSRPVLLTNSLKQFQFPFHQVAHTGTHPQSKSACRYNAVTHFFLHALRFMKEHQSY